MDFSLFKETRTFLLEMKSFESAKRLELSFLRLHPSNVEVLWMSAWTSQALGDEKGSSQLLSLMRAAHENASIVSRERNYLLVDYIVDKLPNIDRHKSLEAMKRLLEGVSLDDSWGWFQTFPIRSNEGEVCEIPGFGKFRVRNPKTVIEKRIARGLPWEAGLVSLAIALLSGIQKEHKGAVVDVGANIGTTAIPMSLNLANKVFAFEPEPSNFFDLTANADLNALTNLVLVQDALGERRGLGVISPGPEDNPGRAIMSVKDHAQALGPDDLISCQIDTIDNRFADVAVDLIKIDVEGFELEVLRGALNVLKRDHPFLVVELLDSEQLSGALELLNVFDYSLLPLGNHNYLFY